MADERRAASLNGISAKPCPVIYWMSRDQRAGDNWALLYAQDAAIRMKQPLAVVFTLAPSFLGAAERQYSFMLEGLALIESRLEKLRIPFFILPGNPPDEIVKFIKKHKAGALVTDFSPLKIHREWKDKVSGRTRTAFIEIDSHNIVPCRLASGKQEFSARTLRPKIHRLLPVFLTPVPAVKRHPFPWPVKTERNDFKMLYKTLKSDKSAGRITWLKPGEEEAVKVLKNFINKKLNGYGADRNNPAKDGQSNLSPYIHFGQISAQRIALEVQRAGKDVESTESFIEELIVRRELAENFCFYNGRCDSFEGIPGWARKTLDSRRKDIREYIYSEKQFENAETHDDLWNAAQREMVNRGKMHGYMRMYWAKKILEWSRTPEEAFSFAVRLNDRYELDGRDPSGYAGIAWSVGGLHDRPWFKRPVFGSVRYMGGKSIRARFNAETYIEQNRN
ncbi:MAG: deoxyribodipyrimidine photo-lyase [Candidatus Omnitrophica bacterium]|nr:deoxyribodipyrimidine photo-lyase [Candidatus Omnitrophota bacterium]